MSAVSLDNPCKPGTNPIITDKFKDIQKKVENTFTTYANNCALDEKTSPQELFELGECMMSRRKYYKTYSISSFSDPLSANIFFEKAADKGHPAAQYEVGKLYYNQNNCLEAIKYFKLAADQKHVDATYYLALCHEKGYGTSVDEKQAFDLYKVAADQGNLYALNQYNKLKQHFQNTS